MRPVIIGGAELVMEVLVYMVAMTRIMLLYTRECALPDHMLYANYSWT